MLDPALLDVLYPLAAVPAAGPAAAAAVTDAAELGYQPSSGAQ